MVVAVGGDIEREGSRSGDRSATIAKKAVESRGAKSLWTTGIKV